MWAVKEKQTVALPKATLPTGQCGHFNGALTDNGPTWRFARACRVVGNPSLIHYLPATILKISTTLQKSSSQQLQSSTRKTSESTFQGLNLEG